MKNQLLILLAVHLGVAAVVAQPVITNQPQNQAAIAGTTALFIVGASGAPPLSYQWRSYLNASTYTNIPFGTEATLMLTNVQPTQRRFAVVVTDAGGLSVTSSPLVTLTVVTPPTITPANPTASLLTDVTLLATGGTAAPRSYQWLFNGSPIPGAVTNKLVMMNVLETNAGAYAIVSTYPFGSATSQVATLTITPFTITPANATASLFADVTFLSTLGSVAPLSFQWLFNGEPMAGAATNKLVVTNVQKTNAGPYALAVTYAFGSFTSQVATLKITPFNSMYCFGFSWTDTHNCAGNWVPASQYYNGRACNGPMWPEFLSTNLGLGYIEQNNYAVCGAEPTDILNQVDSFPAPKKPQLSGYFLWLGASDDAVFNHLFSDDLLRTSNTVQRLYLKGAREIIVQALHDFTKVPYWINFFATDQAGLGKFRTNTVQLNAAYHELMKAFVRAKSDLRIVWVDSFSKLDDLLANPAQHGFTKTDVSALDDTALVDKSFNGPGSDYAFWNSRHGTSKLHQFIAAWTLDALTNSILETVEARIVEGSIMIGMDHLQIGRDYTLQTSSDLTSWNDVQTFTASAGTNQVSQTLETGTRSAFFRLHWQR